MFEETGVAAFHVDRIFGRFRLVVVELLADGTNWAIVAAGTSPGITTVANTTTITLSGVPTGANYWFGGPPEDVVGAVTASITSQNPATGVIVMTATATNNSRLKFFFIVNRTG